MHCPIVVVLHIWDVDIPCLQIVMIERQPLDQGVLNHLCLHIRVWMNLTAVHSRLGSINTPSALLVITKKSTVTVGDD